MGMVQQLRLGVVGAGPPVADAAEVGTEVELDAGDRDHLRPVGHLAGRGVDVEHVLVAEVVGGHERAGRAVELPQDAVLAHLEERLPPPVVDEHALEHVVEVVGLARHELVVPLQLARRGVEGEDAVRVQRVAVGLARHPRPRLGLRGRPVGQVGLGVVGARYPRVGPGPERQGQVAPRVAARLARARDGRRAPHLLSGLRIVGGDEADVVLVVLAPRHAGHDAAVHTRSAPLV